MANATSTIEWTDATWSPTIGCTRVSAGCDACYAFALHDKRHAAYVAGTWPDAPPQYHRPFAEVQLLPERLAVPLRWRQPKRIFVDSMSDVFHAEVPTEFIAEMWAVMALAPRHTFQVLTKRPRRMQRLLNDIAFWAAVADAAMRRRDQWPPEELLPQIGPDKPLPNVWLGTSVENQEAAYRIDWLVKTPAAVRFLSCEPLIGPLDISDRRLDSFTRLNPLTGRLTAMSGRDEGPSPHRLHWIIAGAESGPSARPAELDWFRGLRDQCVAADVPFFLKQFARNGKKIGLPELDGVQWAQMPAVAP